MRGTLIAGGLLLSGCFSPNVQEGLACTEEGACPGTQVCMDGTCRVAGSGPYDGGDHDAPLSDASPLDANRSDAAFVCPTNQVPCGDSCEAECRVDYLSASEDSVYLPEPGCTYVRVQAWGAGGGNGQGNSNAAAGGYGMIELTVSSQETYVVVVGAPGVNAAKNVGGVGGAPGGGTGGSGGSQAGGGGGGHSGFYLNAVATSNARLIAGGGAGSGGGGEASKIRGGAGGGVTGQDSNTPANSPGGTQTAGFAPLVGGTGASSGNNDGGGGGGGGWFGGAGGLTANTDAPGGGGGSGYASDDAHTSDLQTGNRATPGNAGGELRGNAGNPGVIGKVIVTCLPPPT